MSKPEQEEELSVDFFDEVEDIVDEELELEDEQEEEETSEQVEDQAEGEEEESEETEDESQDEEDAEELPVVESIRQRLGYDIEGEFEDTEDGIQMLVEKAVEAARTQQINAFFDQFPDVKEHLEYRQLGGDPDKFFKTRFPEVDYSKVELKEDDDLQHEQIVRQELKQVRGMSNEEIEAEIEDYKNGGILENKAKRSLSALKVKQQQDQVGLIEQQRKQAKQQQEEVAQHWNTVKETLDKSTQIKNVSIPTKDKEPFFEWLSRPVQDGKSKAMIAHEQADLETRLLFDYMLFKDLKFSDLITNRAKDQNAKTLKSRMKSSKLNKKSEERSSQAFEELGEI